MVMQVIMMTLQQLRYQFSPLSGFHQRHSDDNSWKWSQVLTSVDQTVAGGLWPNIPGKLSVLRGGLHAARSPTVNGRPVMGCVVFNLNYLHAFGRWLGGQVVRTLDLLAWWPSG